MHVVMFLVYQILKPWVGIFSLKTKPKTCLETFCFKYKWKRKQIKPVRLVKFDYELSPNFLYFYMISLSSLQPSPSPSVLPSTSNHQQRSKPSQVQNSSPNFTYAHKSNTIVQLPNNQNTHKLKCGTYYRSFNDKILWILENQSNMSDQPIEPILQVVYVMMANRLRWWFSERDARWELEFHWRCWLGSSFAS